MISPPFVHFATPNYVIVQSDTTQTSLCAVWYYSDRFYQLLTANFSLEARLLTFRNLSDEHFWLVSGISSRLHNSKLTKLTKNWIKSVCLKNLRNEIHMHRKMFVLLPVWKCALYHSWRTSHNFYFLYSIFREKTTENLRDDAWSMRRMTRWPASLSTFIYWRTRTVRLYFLIFEFITFFRIHIYDKVCWTDVRSKG